MEDQNVLFFFGAGASRDAKLPTIDDMTSKFYSYKDERFTQKEIENINILKDVIEKDRNKRKDIETLVSMIKDLMEDPSYKDAKIALFPSLNETDFTLFPNIVLKTQHFIRQELENIQEDSITYLLPIKGFMDKTIEIFTLNYDGIIDLFCEKNNIEYCDGFSPYWDPKIFENPLYKLKIYRLHGCLYWFKTSSGKNVKIPVIGLNQDKNKYISSESLNEILIYPTRDKDKYSQIYSWLNYKFIDSINHSKLLILVGYSFRDDDINKIVIEALHNTSLWLLIISPHATEIRRNFFENQTLGLRSRVMIWDRQFQDVLLRGRLYKVIQLLLKTIRLESTTEHIQHQFNDPAGEWTEIVGNYQELGCEDRIVHIQDILSRIFVNNPRLVPSIIADGRNRKRNTMM
jgi:hypothetical protein